MLFSLHVSKNEPKLANSQVGNQKFLPGQTPDHRFGGKDVEEKKERRMEKIGRTKRTDERRRRKGAGTEEIRVR
jgi:hypothetical protein